MGVRIRQDGSVLCAAMHPSMVGDIDLDDQALYKLAVIDEMLIASDSHLHVAECDPEHCKGTITSASGSPVCGDGIWRWTDS